MNGSGIWRAIIGAAACSGVAACSSDQATNVPPPTGLTAAQYALHFDSLAKKLSVSSPGDIRIQWYQEMVRVLALGAPPSLLAIRVAGGPSEVHAVTEVDEFPTQLNAKIKPDSTYILAMWNPPTQPLVFIDVHLYFLPDAGNPDTTRSLVTVFLDTLGRTAVDSTASVSALEVAQRGECVVTPLSYLTVPTNPCVRTNVAWAIEGGTGLLSISPALEDSGIILSP
jgi:hypothetical protein